MSKTRALPFLIAGAVLILAFVLNPSPERHRRVIQDTISDRSPIARMLGLGALASFASNYHSLGVASYTTVGDRTISIGVLGMVFVREPK